MPYNNRPGFKPNTLFRIWNHPLEPKEGDVVEQSLCTKMADDFLHSYSSDLDRAQAREHLADVCNKTAPAEDDFIAQLTDFLEGAGSAINPHPHGDLTFYDSDLEALQSDWMAVWSDLSKVWATVDLFCNRLRRTSNVEHRKSNTVTEHLG